MPETDSEKKAPGRGCVPGFLCIKHKAEDVRLRRKSRRAGIQVYVRSPPARLPSEQCITNRGKYGQFPSRAAALLPRVSSQKATAAAAATFRESTPFAMGSFTVRSQARTASSGSPGPSEPRNRAHFSAL